MFHMTLSKSLNLIGRWGDIKGKFKINIKRSSLKS